MIFHMYYSVSCCALCGFLFPYFQLLFPLLLLQLYPVFLTPSHLHRSFIFVLHTTMYSAVYWSIHWALSLGFNLVGSETLRIKHVLKDTTQIRASITILNQHLCYLVLYNYHFCHIRHAPTVCLMPRHAFILIKHTLHEKKTKKNMKKRGIYIKGQNNWLQRIFTQTTLCCWSHDSWRY